MSLRFLKNLTAIQCDYENSKNVIALEASQAENYLVPISQQKKFWSLFIYILKLCFKVEQAFETKRKALGFYKLFNKYSNLFYKYFDKELMLY